MNDSKRDEIKALKDPYFRRAHGIDAAHPAGAVELTEVELSQVSGAATITVPITIASIRMCGAAGAAALGSARSGCGDKIKRGIKSLASRKPTRGQRRIRGR